MWPSLPSVDSISNYAMFISMNFASWILWDKTNKNQNKSLLQKNVSITNINSPFNTNVCQRVWNRSCFLSQFSLIYWPSTCHRGGKVVNTTMTWRRKEQFCSTAWCLRQVLTILQLSQMCFHKWEKSEVVRKPWLPQSSGSKLWSQTSIS